MGKLRERGNIHQTMEQVKVKVLCDFHHHHRIRPKKVIKGEGSCWENLAGEFVAGQGLK